jgi:hypothetical protein
MLIRLAARQLERIPDALCVTASRRRSRCKAGTPIRTDKPRYARGEEHATL